MSMSFSALFDRKDRKLKAKVFRIYLLLALANIICWIYAVVAFRHYPVLLGTAFLAYSFGLRHAVDADHIAAIDNVTRKLMQEGKQPLGVGLFFSLGHSTIVVGLSVVVALTAVTIKTHFPALEVFGNIIGTLVSSAFLFALALLNVLVLRSLLQTFQRVKRGGRYDDEDLNLILSKRGLLGRLFRGLFRLVSHSWQMYPIGILFGLGFDTATEVGLLGVSAAEAAKGLHIWSIMVFPALFTAGMSLVDTTDSILMLGAYGWAFAKPVRKLYYNLTVTSMSIVVALIVGAVEALGLLQWQLNLSGPLWDMIASVNNNFGVLGYLIIGIFIASWVISVAFYKFRRYDEIDVTTVK